MSTREPCGIVEIYAAAQPANRVGGGRVTVPMLVIKGIPIGAAADTEAHTIPLWFNAGERDDLAAALTRAIDTAIETAASYDAGLTAINELTEEVTP